MSPSMVILLNEVSTPSRTLFCKQDLVMFASVVMKQSMVAMLGQIMPAQTHVLSVDATGYELTYQWYEGTSGDTSNPVYGAVTSSFDPGDLYSDKTYWVRVTDTRR